MYGRTSSTSGELADLQQGAVNRAVGGFLSFRAMAAQTCLVLVETLSPLLNGL